MAGRYSPNARTQAAGEAVAWDQGRKDIMSAVPNDPGLGGDTGAPPEMAPPPVEGLPPEAEGGLVPPPDEVAAPIEPPPNKARYFGNVSDSELAEFKNVAVTKIGQLESQIENIDPASDDYQQMNATLQGAYDIIQKIEEELVYRGQ